jgi:hypothetical protein
MRPLRDPAEIVQLADPALRALLAQRFCDLAHGEPYDPDICGYFVLIDPGDSIPAIEAEIGFSLTASPPCFELIEAHPHPACYEVVFIPGDGDYGIVLIVPNAEGIDADLLRICVAHAVDAASVSPIEMSGDGEDD